MSIADILTQAGLKKGMQRGLEKGLRQGRQEGRQEGKQEGKQEGLLEAARKMLLAGVDAGVVSRAMGLSRQKLTALAKK